MGAIVTVKTEYGDTNYEFDQSKDGVEFKKDLEKGFKKNKIKKTITIVKTKDIKPKVEEKQKYYDRDVW